jgi:hypothetical protein
MPADHTIAALERMYDRAIPPAVLAAALAGSARQAELKAARADRHFFRRLVARQIVAIRAHRAAATLLTRHVGDLILYRAEHRRSNRRVHELSKGE